MFPRVPALYREGATIEIGDFFLYCGAGKWPVQPAFCTRGDAFRTIATPAWDLGAPPPPLGYELIGVPSLSAEAFHYAIVVETESDTYWQDPRRVSL